MIKIFVYAANKEHSEQAVQTLKSAGAEQVELLESQKLATRQPKENRFLFICETPAEKLTALMPEVMPESSYAQELTTWYECQNEILSAYNVHNKRSVLTTLSQLRDLNRLIEQINRQWGLSLNTVEKSETEKNRGQKHALLSYLVQNLIQQTEPLQALANHLAQLSGVNHELADETDALTDYRNLNKTLAILHAEKLKQVSLLDAKNHQLKNSTEEIDNLQLHLVSAQQELNRVIQESNSNKEIAEKEKADLIAARDDQIKVTQEAKEESELLLLQLHQVQEELEKKFIELKASEASEQKAQTRWKRIFKNNPELIDYDSIEIKPLDSKDNCYQWVIKGLKSATFSRKLVSFESFIENGILGLRFYNDCEKIESGLTQWPESAKDALSIEIITAGKSKTKLNRAKAMLELSATDWQLVKLLPKIIYKESQKGSEIREPAAKLIQGLQALPEIFRYDSVDLKQEITNPDYEHIWLILNGASFSKYQWTKFEVRLGAANVNENGFSAYPKLEIPRIYKNKEPFESWYAESTDIYGEKFELRFDLIKKIYDTKVWDAVKQLDKELIFGIIKTLPNAIKNIKGSNFETTRGWDNWVELSNRCKELLSVNYMIDVNREGNNESKY